MANGWSQLSDWLVKIGAGALAGGLIVNEIKRRLDAASETRGHLGRALSDLLEIRYYLSVTKILRTQIEQVAGNEIPPGQAGPLVHLIAPQMLQLDWGALRARYNDAVTALAGIDPILAYRLRSKDCVGPLLHQLGAFALQAPAANPAEAVRRAEFLSWLDEVLEKQRYGLPNLAEASLLVAEKHGWRTKRATKKTLERQDSVPVQEIEDAMKALKSRLQSVAAFSENVAVKTNAAQKASHR